MSRSELLSLPASVPLETGNRAFGIGRTTGYDLARRGEYPCKVLRLGNAYRVITSDLLRVLDVQPPEVERNSDGAGVAAPTPSENVPSIH